MTESERRAAYLDWINRYCNQDFIDDDDPEENTIPPGVELVLQDMVKSDPLDFNVASERAEGLAVTYGNGGLVESFKIHLRPYRRVRFL